ncbi:MAG: MBOAT family O-acyltransferase [Ruminococcus sp.]
MSYTTINFLAFVAITMLVYFLFPLRKQKWIVLLAASYVFYLFAGYKYVAFILFTTVSTYLVALWIDKISQSSKNALKKNKQDWSREQKKKFKNSTKIKKRLVMALVLVLNFGILAFLKYYNFFAGSLNDVIGIFGWDFSAPTLKLFLPLGISFYTFQSMGYIVDVYREKVAPEKNPAKFALFVSFFPQIIQGPISFYDQLAHQLYEPHKFDFTNFKHGMELILWGYFKKLVIADRAVVVITAATGDNYVNFGGTTITFSVLMYALQLYADFSGGIDISRGIAKIFGIEMVDNFKRPYFAKSINDYWRRWHITLGAWMKNYLFYPLAMSNLFINASKKMKNTKFGNTKAGAHIAKVLPTSIASLIVFLMVGIWHGANWKYVAFGLWNGVIIMLSILLKPVFEFVIKKLHINAKSFAYDVFQMFRTFIIVLVGYVFDIAPNFTGAIDMMKRSLFNQDFSQGWAQIKTLGLDKKEYAIIFAGMLLMFVVSVIQERNSTTTLREILDRKTIVIRWSLVFLCIVTILIFGVYGPGYDPAEFVYMQF